MNKMELKEFIEYCKFQHDFKCNQHYGTIHPYSFHLDMVYEQAKLFINFIPVDEPHHSNIIAGIYGHDLIEDARVTYKDIKEIYNQEVADIIYCCTEEKGRNRNERHSEKYFNELRQNEDAIFVKLCDIIANVKYSLLTNSSMFGKYRKEYPHMKEMLYTEQYKKMFDYLEYILNTKK